MDAARLVSAAANVMDSGGAQNFFVLSHDWFDFELGHDQLLADLLSVLRAY